MCEASNLTHTYRQKVILAGHHGGLQVPSLHSHTFPLWVTSLSWEVTSAQTWFPRFCDCCSEVHTMSSWHYWSLALAHESQRTEAHKETALNRLSSPKTSAERIERNPHVSYSCKRNLFMYFQNAS